MLDGKDFLCTNQTYSALDILFYNEIGCVLMIYDENAINTIISKLPRIEGWIGRMAEIPEVAEQDDNLEKFLKEHKIER